MTGTNILDKKTKKSLLNLKYMAYIFILLTFVVGFIGSVLVSRDLAKRYEEFSSGLIAWVAIVFVVSFMIIWGILDVLKLLNNLYAGNIFTHENASIIRKIDKKIIFTIIFSIIVNVVMALMNWHPVWFLLVWLMLIVFLLLGHILVNPLALIVEKSAELQLEMELTI